MRSLLARRIDEDTPITLNDLAADIIEEVADRPDVRAAVFPPDLHVVKGVDTLLSGRSQGSKGTWELDRSRSAMQRALDEAGV
ncbi:hypothetical protein [Streptomyces sp. NPDC001820]|uniref:hypothetical protein n=1 Tax=Streptomyces sp. NPDC001820 TaxID=3364613 RepID=UPI0036A29FB5